MKQNSLNGWFKSGAPGVWISGGAVSIAVIMTIGLLAVIAVRGLGHFWPADLIHASTDTGMGHQVNRVQVDLAVAHVVLQFLHHLAGDLIAYVGPGVENLVVAFALGDDAALI